MSKIQATWFDRHAPKIGWAIIIVVALLALWLFHWLFGHEGVYLMLAFQTTILMRSIYGPPDHDTWYDWVIPLVFAAGSIFLVFRHYLAA